MRKKRKAAALAALLLVNLTLSSCGFSWKAQPTSPTPTPTPELSVIRGTDRADILRAIEDHKCYVHAGPGCSTVACVVELGQEVSCDDWETPIEAEPMPTATPGLIILDGGVEWFLDDWHMTPEADLTLEIKWSGDIIITDALSQTHTISGPATVRFAVLSIEEEAHEHPTKGRILRR